MPVAQYLCTIELGAERYTCRNMFGFGYSRILVSEIDFVCRNPKPEINAKSRNICQKPKYMPKSETHAKSQTHAKI